MLINLRCIRYVMEMEEEEEEEEEEECVRCV
jgi:hypothetical protein